MTITSAELAEALKGCELQFEFLKYGDDSNINIHHYRFVGITPPPKKPEVRVNVCGYLGTSNHGAPMYTEWKPEAAIHEANAYVFAHWLRRETIDGVAQTPTVISADPPINTTVLGSGLR